MTVACKAMELASDLPSVTMVRDSLELAPADNARMSHMQRSLQNAVLHVFTLLYSSLHTVSENLSPDIHKPNAQPAVTLSKHAREQSIRKR